MAAAAPREDWLTAVWAHHRPDDGGALAHLISANELLVELVEPLLPGEAQLLVWFRYEDATGEGTWVWRPVRVAVQSAETDQRGEIAPVSSASARALREAPLSFLLTSANTYASSVPRRADGGRTAFDPIDRIRETRAKTGPRTPLAAFQVDLVEALHLAEALAPGRATAFLAEQLGVGTATVRRWAAATRASS